MSDGRTKSGRIQQLWSIFHNTIGERSPNGDPRRMSYDQLCHALDTMNFFQSLRTSGCTESDDQLLKKMCKLLDPEGNKYITWANFQKVMLSILNAPAKGQKQRHDSDGNRSPTSCVSTAFSSLPTSSELQCLPTVRIDEPPPSPPRLTPPQPHPQYSPSPTLRFGSHRVPLTPVCEQHWTPVSKSRSITTEKKGYAVHGHSTHKLPAAEKSTPLQQKNVWENQRTSPRIATATLDCGKSYTAQAANRLFSAHTSSSSAKTRWGADHSEKKIPSAKQRRNSTGCQKATVSGAPGDTSAAVHWTPISDSGGWQPLVEQATAVVAHYAPIGKPPPSGTDNDPLSALLRERALSEIARGSSCPSPAASRATSSNLIQTAIDAATHRTQIASVALPKARSEIGTSAVGAPFESILSSLAGTPTLSCPTPAPLPDVAQSHLHPFSTWRQDSVSDVSLNSTLAPIPCFLNPNPEPTAVSHDLHRKNHLQAEADRLSMEIRAQEERLKQSAKQLEERFGYRPSPVPSVPLETESAFSNGGSPRNSAVSSVRPESSVSQRPVQDVSAARALKYWPASQDMQEPESPKLTALQRTQLRLAMAL
eukprot:TRINITY_DN1712_c0_g1_i1.p1 TRINITY_DN1712_c0_g1~~TRINITY_DN1712_c0_g1_i1.p1  ORF type:complete len:594 (-),score=43.13 TRINITY_DN1712_c0_g1_i1:42-1823(-)